MTLSTQELAQIRSDIEDYCPDTCTILRGTATQNAIGEGIPAWGTVGTAIPFRLDPPGLRPNLTSVGEQQQTVSPWGGQLPAGTDLQNGDRIVFDENTYEVIQTWGDRSWRVEVRCDLLRID